MVDTLQSPSRRPWQGLRRARASAVVTVGTTAPVVPRISADCAFALAHGATLDMFPTEDQ